MYFATTFAVWCDSQCADTFPLLPLGTGMAEGPPQNTCMDEQKQIHSRLRSERNLGVWVFLGLCRAPHSRKYG